MYKFLRILTLLGLFNLAYLNCQTIHEDVSKHDQAKEHLNKREYDLAIPLLQELLIENPSNNRIRLLLATAYSGSAGVNLIDSYDMFSLFLDPASQKPSKVSGAAVFTEPEDEDGEKNRSAKVKLENEILSFLFEVDSLFYVFFTLPFTGEQGRAKMDEALVVLNDIPQESRYFETANLYSAVINIALFINFVRDGFPDIDHTKPYHPLYFACNLRLKRFHESLSTALRYLVNVNDKLVLGLREDQQKVLEKSKLLKNTVVTVMASLDSAEGIIEGGDILFTKAQKSICPGY